MDLILSKEEEEEAAAAAADSADVDLVAEDPHLRTHIINNSDHHLLRIRRLWDPENHSPRDRNPGIITPINHINNRATMAVITIKTTTSGTGEMLTLMGAFIIINKRIRGRLAILRIIKRIRGRLAMLQTNHIITTGSGVLRT